MKSILLNIFVIAVLCWAIPKPMESIENYNVLMVHGAYGSDKGIEVHNYPEANDSLGFLGNATLGSYTSDKRFTRWLAENVFDEHIYDNEYENVKNSYVYNWRAFTNPANNSINNAKELGNRIWNNDSIYGKRRALVEESQEVKSVFISKSDTLYGQIALDSIRHHKDLYRQLPSRYILIGHSMGGVVAREYVQNSDYYHGDVDKIITLDSPHEGTGALNMQITKEGRDNLFNQALDNFKTAAPLAGVMSVPFFLVKGSAAAVQAGIYTLGISMAIQELSNPITRVSSPEIYYGDDPLVHYVDPLQSGYGTIDSLNKLNYTADSLPMFRILASKYRDRFSGYAQPPADAFSHKKI